jgi:hypothetical protein
MVFLVIPGLSDELGVINTRRNANRPDGRPKSTANPEAGVELTHTLLESLVAGQNVCIVVFQECVTRPDPRELN